MKTELPKNTLIGVMLLFLAGTAAAQSFIPIKKGKDLIVSAGVGSSLYFGDLSDTDEYGDARLALRAAVQLHPWPRFVGNRVAFRSALHFFRLHGSDQNAPNSRVTRNLSFYSNNLEWNASMVIHLLPEEREGFRNNQVNVYAVAGVGMLYTNPKTRYQGSEVALQPLRTEGVSYSNLQPVVPLGFGVKLAQAGRYHISMEATWRYTFTDYLDDTSGRFYANPRQLPSPLAVALSDRRAEYYQANSIDYNPESLRKGDIRGNPGYKDSYLIVTLNVGYAIPMHKSRADRKLMSVRKRKPITK
jgi:hypothetical protein